MEPENDAPEPTAVPQPAPQPVLSIDAPCEPLEGSACASCALFDQGRCWHLEVIESGHAERAFVIDCYYHQPVQHESDSAPGATAQETD